MIPDLKGHVFTLSSQKPERPGNHDLVVGAIAEYLTKNGAPEVVRGLLVGKIPALKNPAFPKRAKKEIVLEIPKEEEGVEVDTPSDEEEDPDLAYERDKSIFNVQSKLWAEKS